MPVLYEKRDHVGIVTLSQPEARNAWGNDYGEGISRYLKEMEADDDVGCAILTGDESGRAFCAGANIKNPQTHTLSSVARFVRSLPHQQQFDVLQNFPKPLIGAINGYAIGIGAIVTFCCDLIVASERAEWRLPQASLGILPAYGGSVRMARWTGRGNVMKLSFGFPIKADEAERIGLAQWVVPHEELLERSLAIADQIASLPPLSARLTKESVVRGMNISNVSDASFVDLYRFAILQMTTDKDEGHAAWREKRQASFSGT